MKKWLKRIGYLILFLFLLLNFICAFQAYRLTHYYGNIPKPPKPTDMSFAQKASAIFFGVKYPKSKVVDSLNIPHEIISLTTSDSLKLEAWYLTAKVSDTMRVHKGTVIVFHGHGSSKSSVIAETEAFYKLGYDVMSVDFRAHGNSEGNTCSIGYEEAKDVKAAYDRIAKAGEKNIILYGISLGSATILKAINDYDLKPSKVILDMPFGTLYGAVKGRLRLMHLPTQPFAPLLTFWGGLEQGFWAFNLKPQEYASKVNCPTLLEWGINDVRVTEEETNTIFKNLATHDKTLIKYVRSGHQSLCENEHDKWVACVSEFLKKR
jgi:esterase/lipase